jgi:ABC-type branched-subunit amino acid transport system substrate-binding protein
MPRSRIRPRDALRRVLLLLPIGLAACGGGGPAGPPGVVGDTIVIGALTPLSDAVAVIGKPLAAGLQAYARRFNESGGAIGGRYKLKVVEEDITYANPSTGAQKYQKIKEDVALMAMVVGTDQVNGLLPLLEEDSVLVIPTTLDLEWVREPFLLPWGTPYQLWAVNGVAYYLSQPGNAGRRICSLVLATGYGEAAVEGLEFAARTMGFEIGVRASFRQDDQDFVAPITQLRNARCDAVVFASLPGVTGKVLGAAAQLGFTPRWIGQGPSWHHGMIKSPLIDYYERHLWIVSGAPEWGDTTVAGMRDLLATVAAYDPEMAGDLYYLNGYVLGRTAHALLEEAATRGDLSRAGVLKAMETVAVRYDGLWAEYRYGPVGSREPPRSVAIARINRALPSGGEVIAADYVAPAALEYPLPAGREAGPAER